MVIIRCEKVEIESIAAPRVIIPDNATAGCIYDWYSSLSVLYDKDKEYIFINNLMIYGQYPTQWPPKNVYNMSVYDNYGNNYNELNYLFPYTPSLYINNPSVYTNILDSCTSPSNNDIITCYWNSFEIECLLLFNNNVQTTLKRWKLSSPQTIFSSINPSNVISPNSYSIQTICVSDGYLVFLFDTDYRSYNGIIQYNLLDLHLNEIETFGITEYIDSHSNFSYWTFSKVLQQTNNNLLFEARISSTAKLVGFTAKYNGIKSIKNALYVTMNNISFNMTHFNMTLISNLYYQQEIIINVNDNCCYMTPYINGPVYGAYYYYYIGLIRFDGQNVLPNDVIFNNVTANDDYRYPPGSFSVLLNMLQNNNNNDSNSTSKYFLISYANNEDRSISGIVYKIDYNSMNNKYTLQNVTNPILLINSTYSVYMDKWNDVRYFDGIIVNNKLFLLWRSYPKGILAQSFEITLHS